MLKAKVPPPVKYDLLGKATAENLGIYPKGGRFKEPLESRQESDAFLIFIFEFAASFTMRGSPGITDDYDRGEELRDLFAYILS